jgi:hypothetical protein
VSIDAKIRQVDEVEGDYLLQLEPRHTSTGWPLKGQSTLLIEQPTWKPEYGMTIWGGDSAVLIETTDGPRRQYTRIGYTRLREQFS